MNDCEQDQYWNGAHYDCEDYCESLVGEEITVNNIETFNISVIGRIAPGIGHPLSQGSGSLGFYFGGYYSYGSYLPSFIGSFPEKNGEYEVIDLFSNQNSCKTVIIQNTYSSGPCVPYAATGSATICRILK